MVKEESKKKKQRKPIIMKRKAKCSETIIMTLSTLDIPAKKKKEKEKASKIEN